MAKEPKTPPQSEPLKKHRFDPAADGRCRECGSKHPGSPNHIFTADGDPPKPPVEGGGGPPEP